MRRRLVMIAIGTVVVLGALFFSALLARVWSADGAENDALTSLIQAEARGDQSAMIGKLQGCSTSAPCRARVESVATALTRPGGVSILRINSSTGFNFGGSLGTARVAWKSPTSLPIVQCVRVRRTGNALKGLRIELLELSARIKSDGDCPAQF